MKTFNEIMKIRDEPDNKPEVTKRKFQVKKTNNEKMQAFGWASVAIAENGETLEDWQGDIMAWDTGKSTGRRLGCREELWLKDIGNSGEDNRDARSE